MDQCLSTARGEKERMRLGPLQVSVPHGWDPVHSHRCSVAAHTSFRTAVQGSSSLLARNRYSSGGWAGATQHTLKRNKEVHIKPSTGNERPKRGERPAQAVRALHVFARKCSRAQATLMQPCRGGASFRGLPFPTRKSKGQCPGLWLKQLCGWWVQ